MSPCVHVCVCVPIQHMCPCVCILCIELKDARDSVEMRGLELQLAHKGKETQATLIESLQRELHASQGIQTVTVTLAHTGHSHNAVSVYTVLTMFHWMCPALCVWICVCVYLCIEENVEMKANSRQTAAAMQGTTNYTITVKLHFFLFYTTPIASVPICSVYHCVADACLCVCVCVPV